MGAAFHRGKSRQDYRTPREFLDAVEARFGPIAVDLAASSDNAACDEWIDEETDSLTVDWHKLKGGLLFLNPPFSNIGPWAAKCARESELGARVAFLVPASTGSNWYWDYVHGRALVMMLHPRLSFDGKNPFPKDCLLAVYGEPPGFERWHWKTQCERRAG